MHLGAAIVVLCALGIIAYGNGIGNGFVWDDHQQVVMNPDLRSGASLLHFFSADVRGSALSEDPGRINYYRPLQMLTYRLVADLFGFDARAFHAVSLAFDLGAVVLAFYLFYSLTSRLSVAFAATALFAVYPVHSEAVDWISALPDIGCTIFVLLAFLLFRLAQGRKPEGQSIRHPQVARPFVLVFSCVAFATALLWKETAITFPLIIGAYVLCFDESGRFARRVGNAVRLSVPYWVVLGGYLFLRFRVLGFIVTAQRNWVLSRLGFGLTVAHLVLGYWLKLIVPIHLNAYYVFSPVRAFQDPRAIEAILFLVLAAGTIMYGMRRAPLAAFSALWVFITIIPVLDVYAVGRNAFAERYLYLPSVGFCLLVILAAVRVGDWIPVRLRSWVAAAVLGVVVLFFSVRTIARNFDWKDDSTLFACTLESSPDAPFVQNMVAATQKEDPEGARLAEAHYLRAISLAETGPSPDRLQIAIAGEGLASIYAGRGEFDRALGMLDKVRIANPEDPEVDGEQGLILTQAGRWVEAEAALRRAVAIAPNDSNVLNALGLIAWQHGNRLGDAVAYFSRALAAHIETDDFSASLHNNLGAVFGEQGRLSDAIAQMKLATELAPSDPEYHTNLAMAFESVGRINDARAELEAALAVAPEYNPALVALRRLPNR